MARDRGSLPLDFGRVMPDGERLFGAQQHAGAAWRAASWRACCSRSTSSFLCRLGADSAALSLAADACSSAAKRRMRLKPCSEALGLDQLAEALVPRPRLRRTAEPPAQRDRGSRRVSSSSMLQPPDCDIVAGCDAQLTLSGSTETCDQGSRSQSAPSQQLLLSSRVAANSHSNTYILCLARLAARASLAALFGCRRE